MMTKLPIEQTREATAKPEVFAAAGAAVASAGGRRGSFAGKATVVLCARGALALATGAEVPGLGTINLFWHAGQVISSPQ